MNGGTAFGEYDERLGRNGDELCGMMSEGLLGNMCELTTN
jgi:hypothetical protein